MGSPAWDFSPTIKQNLLLLLLAWVWMLFGQSAHAEKYAVVIGIGEYPAESGLRRLEGPANDARELRNLLVSSYGFASGNVRVLVDAAAKKQSILQELDRLAEVAKRNDYIFLYYSGHGTGGFDVNLEKRWNVGINPDTGALFPVDFRPGSPEDVSNRLIIGTRDLRPRLSRLEPAATVFAVFDTCFSGNSIKRWRPVAPVTKYVPLRDVVRKDGGAGSFEQDAAQILAGTAVNAADEDYPYSNVVYFSAATKFTPAEDISSLEILSGTRQTVDGKPHGVMTNALLSVLMGKSAGSPGPGASYEQLFSYLNGEAISNGWSHIPGMLYPKNRLDLLQAPVFQAAHNSPVAVQSAARVIQVRVEDSDENLVSSIRAIKQVQVSNESYDMLVRRTGSQYMLVQSSGFPISEEPLNRAELLARIAAEPNVRRLLDFRCPADAGSSWLRITPEQGIYAAGQEMSFTARTDAAYGLLLDIDQTGSITVLFPGTNGGKLQPRTDSPIGNGAVSKPFGTEYLKLLTFTEFPPAYESWVREQNQRFSQEQQVVNAGSRQYNDLLNILTTTQRCSEAKVRINTVERLTQ
jgi:hypothetical protein